MRDQWEALLRDWRATMRAEHKSPKTITPYELAVNQLVDHLESRGWLVAVGEVTRADGHACLPALLAE